MFVILDDLRFDFFVSTLFIFLQRRPRARLHVKATDNHEKKDRDSKKKWTPSDFG